MAKQIRTAALMVYTDGTTSVYHVMRGPMKGSKSFNLAKAETVAVYKITKEDRSRNYQDHMDGVNALYRDMVARHATADAPAVYWQA